MSDGATARPPRAPSPPSRTSEPTNRNGGPTIASGRRGRCATAAAASGSGGCPGPDRRRRTRISVQSEEHAGPGPRAPCSAANATVDTSEDPNTPPDEDEHRRPAAHRRNRIAASSWCSRRPRAARSARCGTRSMVPTTSSRMLAAMAPPTATRRRAASRRAVRRRRRPVEHALERERRAHLPGVAEGRTPTAPGSPEPTWGSSLADAIATNHVQTGGVGEHGTTRSTSITTESPTAHGNTRCWVQRSIHRDRNGPNAVVASAPVANHRAGEGRTTRRAG